MYVVTVIEANGAKRVLNYSKAPDLRSLQGWVDGLIQPIPHWVKHEGRKAETYCNEEARLKNLPLNETATKLWQDALGYSEMTKERFRYTPELFGAVVIVQKVGA